MPLIKRNYIKHSKLFRSIIILLSCLFGFFGLVDELYDHQILAFDSALTNWVESIRSPFIDSFFGAISYLGYEGVIIGTVALTLIFLSRQLYKQGIWIASVVSLGGLLNRVLKNIIQRPRPNISPQYFEAGYSLPSGHAMGSIIFCGAVMYIISTTRLNTAIKLVLSALLTIVIILVGLSRIYLGVHYPSDIIAAWLAGGAYLATVYIVILSRK